MIAGLPGAGISAYFYLLCAAFMPVVACWRWLRTNPRPVGQRSVVIRQVMISLTIVAALIVAGLLLALVLPPARVSGSAGSLADLALQTSLAIGRIGALLGVLTMILVLGTVYVMAWLDRRARPRPPRRASYGNAMHREMATIRDPARARTARERDAD